MDSLSIPDPGPSASGRRPSSVQPHVPSSASQSSSARRQRASHTISPTQTQDSRHDDRPVYQDVYSHPAAIAFAAAHPRRTIPKFGPYLLLQTLGEGEFGKVKLGLHSQWGEEVAVKLIRRGNIETPIRMSKVEREIEVLRVRQLFLLPLLCKKYFFLY
jgi:protein-serine/threonine kinase